MSLVWNVASVFLVRARPRKGIFFFDASLAVGDESFNDGGVTLFYSEGVVDPTG
jgi:hypothetical protein